MIEDAAGLIAPVATMIAAMMTAANLGARVTGWGFVVFTAGSVCWSLVALATGQTNLLATNIFLTLVNLVGIWRWLGRQRAYEDGAEAAMRKSSRPEVPTLFSATGLSSMPVSDVRGEAVGRSVEAMIECGSGQISYIIIASGGIAGFEERLRSVPLAQIDCHADGLIILETRTAFERRETLDPNCWPVAAAEIAGRGEADSRSPAIENREKINASV
jgi:sporulation protein YlmC with PRC-barrel domain